MSQDPSIDAARARIQRLVEEISALSRKEIRSEEYFPQVLARVVQATDAKGGAIWLAGQRAADAKSEFQLAAQIEFDSSLLHADSEQHALILRALSEVIKSKRPIILPPEPPEPAAGSLDAEMKRAQGQESKPGSNKAPYPFFHLPLLLKDQALGVLQVWLQPYVQPAAYGEFVTFLTSIAGHIEQHLQSRRLGNLVMENQRLQHVLKFTGDLAGSLDPLEVARLSVNYGRDLIGCERCSILTLRGDHWKVLAISGQEVVEQKSSMVKAMAAFVSAHAQPAAFARSENDPRTGAEIIRHRALVLSKKDLLARAEAGHPAGLANGAPANGTLMKPPDATDVIDIAYFEHSRVISATVAPLLDHEKQLVGAYFAESTAEGFFDAAPGSREASSAQRLTEWIALHTGKSLEAALDYHSLPLRPVGQRVRAVHRAFTGRKRGRAILRASVLLAVLLVASFYPKVDQIDGNCAVTPSHRGIVVPEVPGRLEKILVREGDRVSKGQALAQIDTSRLETELEGFHQERLRAEAEAGRFSGQGDEAAAQISRLQAEVAGKNAEKIQADVASATLRSPIEGVVLTKDLELHAGEFLQAGSPFAEVAALDDWDLQVEISEKKIGRVEAALAAKSPRDVGYILYSQSARKLVTQLQSPNEISAIAYPREKDQVFIVTLPSLALPPEIKSALRPGLTGRAKIELGREPGAWWFCKRAADWLRLKFLG